MFDVFMFYFLWSVTIMYHRSRLPIGVDDVLRLAQFHVGGRALRQQDERDPLDRRDDVASEGEERGGLRDGHLPHHQPEVDHDGSAVRTVWPRLTRGTLALPLTCRFCTHKIIPGNTSSIIIAYSVWESFEEEFLCYCFVFEESALLVVGR